MPYTREQIEQAAALAGVDVLLDGEPECPYGRQAWLANGGILSRVCPGSGQRLYDPHETARSLYHAARELFEEGLLGISEDAEAAEGRVERLTRALDEPCC